MSTIFTHIIDRQIPADIVYEDEFCMAFKDINPQAPVHVLLVPKKEIVSMATVETEDQTVLGHLMVKASEIASMLGLSEGGYRLVVNTNEDAGQSVYHLHIHILGGRKFTWPPG